MPIDRGSRRSRRFHPYPTAPTAASHPRLAALAALAGPTHCGGWDVATAGGHVGGTCGVKMGEVFRSFAEQCGKPVVFPNETWSMVGGPYRTTGGMGWKRPREKTMNFPWPISGCSNNAVDHWHPQKKCVSTTAHQEGVGDTSMEDQDGPPPRPKGGTPPHKSLSKTSLSPTTTNSVLWHSMMHIQARKTACAWREIISVYKNICVYVYIYISIERERDGEKNIYPTNSSTWLIQ